MSQSAGRAGNEPFSRRCAAAHSVRTPGGPRTAQPGLAGARAGKGSERLLSCCVAAPPRPASPATPSAAPCTALCLAPLRVIIASSSRHFCNAEDNGGELPGDRGVPRTVRATARPAPHLGHGPRPALAGRAEAGALGLSAPGRAVGAPSTARRRATQCDAVYLPCVPLAIGHVRRSASERPLVRLR